ncbi:MAG: hypothetical protein ACREQY_01550, partial [Candidatus Binatia bacterium]
HALLGERTRAIELLRTKVAKGDLSFDYFPAAPQLYGYESLVHEPTYPLLIAELESAKAALLARYPVD